MLDSFIEEVTEPKKRIISPRRLSEALHMGVSELARTVNLHRNTLATKPDSAKVQERLGEITRIIATAADLTGDPDRAVIWFRHQPLGQFDYKTAEQLVHEGQGAAVVKHLEMLSDGVYA